jgi:proteasome lid subunit RPN8/RPN11
MTGAPFVLDASITDEIARCAVAGYPREVCGLVVVAGGIQRFLACRNVAQAAEEHF